MPDSPPTLRSAYLRMDDGKPALVIVREDGAGELFQLRPAQLASLGRDAANMVWGHYDLVERK